MKARWTFVALGVGCVPAALVACATEGTAEPAPRDAASETDAPPDVADGGDAGACADCAYFPDACTEGTLCQAGPFAAGAPGGGLDPRTRIYVVRGRSPNDVWAAGALGSLAHFDGTSWTLSDPGVRMTMPALWLRDSGEIALASMHALYTRGLAGDADASAGGWSASAPPATPPGYSASLTLVSTFAAPSAQWLWCATNNDEPVTGSATSGLWRIRRSADGAFEIGIGIAPEACRSTYPCSQMTNVHGLSANELWAVGAAGATLRIRDADGETPTAEPFNSQTMNALFGVWVAPNGEAWSVGAAGTIRHYHGDVLLWDVVTDVPTRADLNAIWGTSTSDIWAAGDVGVVLHYDGARWSRVPIAGLGQRRPNLTTIWTATEGHVWIGGQGVLLSLGGKP